MDKTLLVTLRDPGPAYFVAEALPRLADTFNVTIIATDPATSFLASRYPNIFARENVQVYVPDEIGGELRFVRGGIGEVETSSRLTVGTRLPTHDVEGILRLKHALQRVVGELNFTHILRTTPAHMVGVDEVIATALRENGWRQPVLCLQDFYGVGLCLRGGEISVLPHGVDRIATVDTLAAEIVSRTLPLTPVYIVGWIAHNQFVIGKPFLQARQHAREMLGLRDQDLMILYAGSKSGLPIENDLDDFIEVTDAIQGLMRGNTPMALGFKAHPRMLPEEIREYADAYAHIHQSISPQVIESLPYEYAVAAPDLVISSGSALNIDAIAYRATAPDSLPPNVGPVSLYTTDGNTQRAVEYSTGMTLLPVHLPGNGSFVADYQQLRNQLGCALFDQDSRSEVHRRASSLFRPTGQSAELLTKFLEGAGD